MWPSRLPYWYDKSSRGSLTRKKKAHVKDRLNGSLVRAFWWLALKATSSFLLKPESIGEKPAEIAEF